MVKNSHVSALYVQVFEVYLYVQDNGSLVTVPHTPNGLPPVPTEITTDAITTCQIFGRSVTRQMRHSDNNNIALVKINIRKHQIPLYDDN